MHATYHMFFPYSVTVQLLEQGPVSHCEECNRCCKRCWLGKTLLVVQLSTTGNCIMCIHTNADIPRLGCSCGYNTRCNVDQWWQNICGQWPQHSTGATSQLPEPSQSASWRPLPSHVRLNLWEIRSCHTSLPSVLLPHIYTPHTHTWLVFTMHAQPVRWWVCIALFNRGQDLSGNTVGIAYLNTMCGSASVGLVQDGSRSTSSTGSTFAHELGHIFSMEHDTSMHTCWLSQLVTTSYVEFPYYLYILISI